LNEITVIGFDFFDRLALRSKGILTLIDSGKELSAVRLVDLEEVIVLGVSPLVIGEIAVLLDIDLRDSHEFISSLVAGIVLPDLSSATSHGHITK
jgi:hypothetical protein